MTDPADKLTYDCEACFAGTATSCGCKRFFEGPQAALEKTFSAEPAADHAGPGDGGPCPICGEDMAAKIYQEELITGDVIECSGRYWHMSNEHGILEDYFLALPGQE